METLQEMSKEYHSTVWEMSTSVGDPLGLYFKLILKTLSLAKWRCKNDEKSCQPIGN
jgi:hypothetical protein